MHLSTTLTLLTTSLSLAAPLTNEPGLELPSLGAALLKRQQQYDQQQQQSGTPSSSGRHEGYYYLYWTDGSSPVNYTNEAGGEYSVKWKTGGNFLGGKGWNPGGRRSVTYSGTFDVVNNTNSYLSIYGWTLNPSAEYYILENHGSYNPSTSPSLTPKGTLTLPSGTYNLYQSIRVGLPSFPTLPGSGGPGTPSYYQYWAIRTEKRTGGTVDTGAVFDAWERVGMRVGVHDLQIVAVEGYFSQGEARVRVETGPE